MINMDRDVSLPPDLNRFFDRWKQLSTFIADVSEIYAVVASSCLSQFDEF